MGFTSDDSATGEIQFDKKGQIVPDEGTPSIIVIPNDEVGSEDIEIELDFSQLTMYAADSSVKPTNVDGYPRVK